MNDKSVLPKRIASKIVSDDVGVGCWTWIAGRQNKGYGVTGFGAKKKMLAHRAIYEILAGPIPHGMELDHLCRSPICVNPAHMEPVSHKVNCLRGISDPSFNAKKTHCIRGHALTEDNLVKMTSKLHRRRCLQCSRLDNIKQRKTA